MQKLKSMKQLDRKELLTKTFGILWVSWVITVMPYTIKQAVFVPRGKFINLEASESIDTLLSKIVQAKTYGSQIDLASSYVYIAITILDSFLRTLKISYGFINSIILIILMKPFNEPILNGFKLISSKFKKNRVAIEK